MRRGQLARQGERQRHPFEDALHFESETVFVDVLPYLDAELVRGLLGGVGLVERKHPLGQRDSGLTVEHYDPPNGAPAHQRANIGSTAAETSSTIIPPGGAT